MQHLDASDLTADRPAPLLTSLSPAEQVNTLEDSQGGVDAEPLSPTIFCNGYFVGREGKDAAAAYP